MSFQERVNPPERWRMIIESRSRGAARLIDPKFIAARVYSDLRRNDLFNSPPRLPDEFPAFRLRRKAAIVTRGKPPFSKDLLLAIIVAIIVENRLS